MIEKVTDIVKILEFVSDGAAGTGHRRQSGLGRDPANAGTDAAMARSQHRKGWCAMTTKSIVTAGLLGFVALSLLVAVADVAGWRADRSQPSSGGVVASVEVATADSQDATPRLAAIYFHATHRCPTCKKIEAYSHEALQPDIDGGKLTWETADYTAPRTKPWRVSSKC